MVWRLYTCKAQTRFNKVGSVMVKVKKYVFCVVDVAREEIKKKTTLFKGFSKK